MKRLFSVVLIIACLGLCACKPKEKVNDTINPAFYSIETLVDWCEENDVANFEPKYINGLIEFYDERPITRDMLEEYLSSVIGDKKMVYSCGTQGENLFDALISDVPALYCLSGPDLWKKDCYSDDMEVGGLCVQIIIKEDFELSDKYDSFEEYVKEGPYSEMHRVYAVSPVSNVNAENWDNVIEVSDLTYARYYTADACYPAFPTLYYAVELQSFDSESGNYVTVQYNMPVEDNEDEIQELRDLGIPVITDFIE